MFASMIEQIQKLLCNQAGNDAYGTLLGDSSGFSIMNHEDWKYAKKGIISRRGFDKLHILLSPHGMIISCKVTKGRRHDSPAFRKMFKKWIPASSGYVKLDAAYLSKENCKLIKESGRIPV